MKNVFVNGYGSIGSRIAEFIKDDSEINVIGVGKHSPDEKVDLAIKNGFSVYVPQKKIDNFKLEQKFCKKPYFKIDRKFDAKPRPD